LPPRRDVVLDTGPLLGYLNPRDQWHARAAATWATLLERLVTTEAVVTEACHLCRRAGGPSWLPLELLLSVQVPILSLGPSLHALAVRLMREYATTPMDYADASLVTLAAALGTRRVFTTDRRGFSVYRLAGGKRFEVVG
jgi:predicted nucleic acid-binding protein